jgi:predicted TIM-barrel fold metal-dependent hydrolase
MDPEDAVAPSVIEQLGDENMVWASDYPHIDSPFPGAVKETLEVLAPLSEASRRKVLGTNALRLYGIEAPR